MATRDLWNGADVVWVGRGGRDASTAGRRAVVVDAGRHHVRSFGALAPSGGARRGRIEIETPDGRRHRVGRTELELVTPAHPLQPEPDAGRADWWIDQLRPDGHGDHVDDYVPTSLGALAAVLHPWSGPHGWATWATVAREVASGNRSALIRAAFDTEPIPTGRPGERYHTPDEGHPPRQVAEVLVDLLGAATSTPGDVVVAVWTGWGDVPVQRFPGAAIITDRVREQFLLRGPVTGLLESLSAVDGDDSVQAGTWWPHDRAWFVHTEVDFPWTFVAGSAATVEALRACEDLETVPLTPETAALDPFG